MKKAMQVWDSMENENLFRDSQTGVISTSLRYQYQNHSSLTQLSMSLLSTSMTMSNSMEENGSSLPDPVMVFEWGTEVV